MRLVSSICADVLKYTLYPVQVLEVKPELANFTFFNYQYNVMHHAAGGYPKLSKVSKAAPCHPWLAQRLQVSTSDALHL